jgi:hypothetical protein
MRRARLGVLRTITIKQLDQVVQIRLRSIYTRLMSVLQRKKNCA